MAESSGNGATPWLAFLIGGLVIAIAVIAFVAYGGGRQAASVPAQVSLDINLPKAPSIPDAPKLPDNPVPTPK